MIARRTLLAGLATAFATGVRAADTTLRLAQYKAGDQLLLRLSGQDGTPYCTEWAKFASGNLMLEAVEVAPLYDRGFSFGGA